MEATARSPVASAAPHSLAHAGETYELRFESLFEGGRAMSFPCDAGGQVSMDNMTERQRINYMFARGATGRDYACPLVVPSGR